MAATSTSHVVCTASTSSQLFNDVHVFGMFFIVISLQILFDACAHDPMLSHLAWQGFCESLRRPDVTRTLLSESMIQDAERSGTVRKVLVTRESASVRLGAKLNVSNSVLFSHTQRQVISIASLGNKNPLRDAGLADDDILLRCDGKDLFSIDDLLSAVRGKNSFSLEYVRPTMEVENLGPEQLAALYTDAEKQLKVRIVHKLHSSHPSVDIVQMQNHVNKVLHAHKEQLEQQRKTEEAELRAAAVSSYEARLKERNKQDLLVKTKTAPLQRALDAAAAQLKTLDDAIAAEKGVSKKLKEVMQRHFHHHGSAVKKLLKLEKSIADEKDANKDLKEKIKLHFRSRKQLLDPVLLKTKLVELDQQLEKLTEEHSAAAALNTDLKKRLSTRKATQRK